MKRKWKILVLVLALLVIVGGIAGGIQYSKRGIVTVQTGKVVRQDLTSLVTASGEIKPKNYINIGTNAMSPSRIIEIAVVEGQKVKKGQLLARLESVQPEAEVAAQRASLSSSEAESAAAKASLNASEQNLRTAKASVDRAKAELERARVAFDRARLLHEEKLISQQEFDQRKADFEALSAGLRESEAREAQAQAQLAQVSSQLAAAEKRVSLAKAQLRRASDVLRRTYAVSPIDGVVTNLPVRVGENCRPRHPELPFQPHNDHCRYVPDHRRGQSR